MADTITLYTIGGDECIGDSLPKINYNTTTIKNSINELYTLYNTVNVGIPAAQTLEFYQTELRRVEEKADHIFSNQTNFDQIVTDGVLAVDFLVRPYSTILSAICFTLSSFNIEQPSSGINNQILVYDLYTTTWKPSSITTAIQSSINPNGYRISTWDTSTATATKITSSSYISLPGGLIMQFGRLSAAAGDGVAGRSNKREIYVQFPLPFPNNVLNITTNTVVSGIDGGVSAQSYIKQGFDRFGFTIVKSLSGNGNVFEMWNAIGI